MFQANEVLKMILGIGEVLSSKILVYNILNNEQQNMILIKVMFKTLVENHSKKNIIKLN